MNEEDYLKKEFIGRFANIQGNYKVIAGSNEFDINYYPYSPVGKNRIIVIFGENARLLAANKKKGIIEGIINFSK